MVAMAQSPLQNRSSSNQPRPGPTLPMRFSARWVLPGWLLLLTFLFPGVEPVLAQQLAGDRADGNDSDAYEFSFARLVYDEGGWSDWPRWRADWPEAEWHFSRGIDRLTRIDVHPEGVLVRLDDDAVFDYPWMYAVEVGSLTLSQSESNRLREYLLRGGFLMVDDFHGLQQWKHFERVMHQVFPEYAIEELSGGYFSRSANGSRYPVSDR